MTAIYLVRHGRPASSWGDDNPNPGLDALGVEQANAVAAHLLALPEQDSPSRVISSPLRRCRETAAPLALALSLAVEVDAAVGEIPTPKGVSVDQRATWLRRAFEGEWAEIAGDIDYEAWRRNVVGAVVRYPGAAIFSHFVAINAVLSCLSGDARVLVSRPDHTSVTRLDAGPRGLTLVERGAEASTDIL